MKSRLASRDPLATATAGFGEPSYRMWRSRLPARAVRLAHAPLAARALSTSMPLRKRAEPTTLAAEAPADLRGQALSSTLRKMLSLAWEERWPLTAALTTIGATSAISLYFPAAIGQVLDVALDTSVPGAASGVAGGLLALFIV
jgi:hypothetical protein